MAKYQMIKLAGGMFAPVDDMYLDKLNRFENGGLYEIEIKKSNNPNLHRKLFAFFKFCFSHWKPVPLAYGLIRTGSLIISQGLETMTITTNKPADTKKPAIKTRLRSKMRGQQ